MPKREYKGLCERCQEVFFFTRKGGMSPSSKYPKYCPLCRGIKIKETQEKNGGHNRRHYESRFIDSSGYAHILVNGKYESEHRYVMEQLLGRPLKRGENVHHKDGDRANNNPGNLELWLHPQIYGQRARDLICPHCGKPYSL